MTTPTAPLPGTPWLPPGDRLDLPGRGTTFVRDGAARHPDADGPPLLLLHGWGVTADLNFFPAYRALLARHRVVALDHRGHGRGIRPPGGIVRLTDCADDAAALLDQLGIDRAIVVGYSMGGAIAQLLWRRHRDRVAGMVLGSTARHFQGGPLSGLWYRSYTPLAHLAHRTPGPAEAVVRWRIERRVGGEERAAWMRAELEQADPAGLTSAMRSIGRFSSTAWIGDVDVPTAVLVAARDRTVPAAAQRRLAAAIPASIQVEVDGPHDSIVTRADTYVPLLADAVARVAAS